MHSYVCRPSMKMTPRQLLTLGNELSSYWLHSDYLRIGLTFKWLCYGCQAVFGWECQY